ncbi:TraR/DksA C4-type zinc finger protein [Hoeflea sp.]|uniref:TraR/DksA C4-type zinc finger protein n=1 Tax=Hoeflea sp. TaxID=1940281 RepID=UPI003BB1BFC4
MSGTDFMIEQAEARVALERDLKLGAVTALVGGAGSPECRDCGSEIPQARRAAAPWAERCITCQETFERGRR